MDRERRQESLCRVEMLGPLRLVRGDQTLTRFGTQKSAALLAYLALRPGPHPREHLLDRFWSDMDLPAGRNNLSTTLVALRRLVEPPGVRKGDILLATNAHVGLNPAAVTTDVADFERLLAEAARADGPGARAARLQAAALYRGDLLPGVYDDWAVSESGRLQARHLETLDRLAEDLETQSQWAEAIGVRLRRLACDPFDEEAQCRLILLQTHAGRAGAGRESYEKFTRLFQEEFGAAPSAGIRSRIETALADASPARPADPGPRRASPPPAPAAPSPAPEAPTEAGAAAPALAAPLPLWLSGFFGREAEMASLAGLLLRSKATRTSPDLPERAPRLVTLVGPGGTGKTRLAVEFARQTSERSDHWCGFVPLSDVTDPGRLADAVAQALRLTPSPDVSPREQVVAFFQGRDRPGNPQAFLILDNLEHLLGSGAAEDIPSLIQALLTQAPGLSLLCTSRRRVGLQGERVVEVPLLPVPRPPATESGPEALASLLAVPSVRLYVDRAQAVRPDFALTPTNAAAVAALCRQLEGSPLGLELAAAWVRLLPPRKMWERLTQGQEMPEGRYSDTPLRHRSLSAALEWSCRLLTPAQQALFARLSVFQGGWTAEAAEAVCEEPGALTLLADLQDASLVTATETTDGEVRYGFLETVRAFARRRLGGRGEDEELRRRHLHYFLSLARGGHEARRGPQAGAWLDRLEAEHNNLRAALERCAAGARAAGLSEIPGLSEINAGMELATALRWFWATRGHVAEGRARLAAALAPPGGSPGIRARALLAVGALAWQSGAAREARPFAEEALALLSDPPDKAGLSDALWLQGSAAASLNEWDEAQDRYARSLALSQELGDTAVIQGTLGNLGHVAFCRGDRQKARALFEESLALARDSGNRAQMALMLNNLGDDALVRGDLAAAQALAEESLALSRSLGRRNGFIVDTLTLLCLIAMQDSISTVERRTVRAREALGKALELCRECGDRGRGLGLLELSARLSLVEDRPAAAARLLGAALALRESLSLPHAAAERSETSQDVAGVQAALGEKEFRAEWNAGSRMTWEEAMDCALDKQHQTTVSIL